MNVVTEPEVNVERATTPAPRKEHSQMDVLGGAQWLLTVVVIATFVMTFVVQAFEIPSESMENTLLIGDYLLVDKVQYAGSSVLGFMLPYRAIQRGDIIVFRYPVRPAQHFVKRVIGIPGDRVRISNKQVIVNGEPIAEPYTIHKRNDRDHYRDDFPTTKYISGNVESKWWIQMRKLTEDGNLIVPEGHYFVLGDNRDDSLDSRYWGFVPVENIVGRPLIIYWSVDREREENPEIKTMNAKLERLTNIFKRLFRDTRWKRTMTVVH
ncbi:MAG TPA: signal peptidase I [Terriglobales bacterium]|nr:signal peptidase I [Terriglobales bacterium]